MFDIQAYCQSKLEGVTRVDGKTYLTKETIDNVYIEGSCGSKTVAVVVLASRDPLL